jgi:hypothetical protein
MNTKRYWLRGGVIAALVFLVANLLYYYFSFCRQIGLMFSANQQGLIGSPAPGTAFFDYWRNLPNYCFHSPNFMTFIIQPLIWTIIIGVILGWLYGKIKNKSS